MPGELYIEHIEKQNVVDLTSVTELLELTLGKLNTFVVFQGETTGDGAPDGSTLLCSDFAVKPDYDGNQVVITSGPYAGQARDIDGSTKSGTLAPHLPFDGPIVTGTSFAILALRTVPAEVASVATQLASVSDQLQSALTDLNAFVVFQGETSEDGASDGSTLLCSALSSKPDYDGNQVVITSGPYAGQARDIDGYTKSGPLVPHLPFGGQITAGTSFAILAIRTVSAEVAALANQMSSLVVFQGKASGDGASDGSTLQCSDLASKPDYDGNQVVITSGPYTGQARDIEGSTTGGTVTPHLPFDGQIVEDTNFAILAIRTVSAEVASLANRLSGEPPESGSVTGDWNSGTATSGEAGADVATIGADGTKYKLHSLLVDIGRGGLAGTEIHIRLFMMVNGAEQKVYDQTFDTTSDPPALWIVNGTVGIHEALRVELQSNDAADDGREVHYDYLLEAM